MLTKRSQRYLLLSLLWGFCLALILGGIHRPAIAHINATTIVEILDGEEVFIENQQAKVDDRATFQQTIQTQESRASLLFNNSAAGRMGPESSITVGQCIEVQQGSLLASGPANGCTANFTIDVQGTVYMMEVNEQGGSSLKVLEGEVEVTPKGNTKPIAINQGEQLNISPDGIFGKIVALSQGDVESLLRGVLFEGFEVEIPGMEKLQAALENLYPNIDLPRLPGFSRPNIPRPRIPRPFF
ncbi:hypothetical protein IQ249_19690 [Lusitaniella coriacea LEGE 07157]|uniref:FecR protein domain-containing protein n=1 Tax=Lusitaniella coriacea LEGE 07157 TaxID=945747 RepID=A0A8J7E1Z2_9CYAN|nr:hypothetical protein [Lusitaniella coriacea]MBE9118121.1 hypothetical protein [Lusitaniella coriacea LEGE 07157]